MASEEFCPKRILERELLAGKDTTKANEKFSPKCILENEFLAGMDTNGTSLDDLWKDAPLWKKQWCVWSASQAVLFEVTGQLLEERGEEGIAPLLQNPSFTDEVFPGKYETCIMEPPTTLTRERVRSTCSLNETKEILLHNRLLRRDIDPLMPRAQQVEALLQLEGGTEFRVSTSCSNEDNSDDTAGIKDTASAGIKAPIERYPNTALPTAATATTTAAATFFATTTASAAAVTSTSITAPAATPTTASAAAVTSTSITATAATPSTAAVRPPVTAFTPSSAVAAATAIDAVAEGNTYDAFAIAAAAGIAYDAVKKEDVVPASISAAAYAAATNAFDTASASADLFDESAASACTGCAAVYDFYFRYTGEEEETHPSLYNNNNMSSSSFYNNNNNNNKPSSSLYNNKNKPSSSLYNNNYKPSSFYNNINDPRLVGFLANKMESKKRKRDDLKVDGFYLKRLRYDNKPSCSLYYNNTKPSSSLYNNNNNDPRLFGFSAHKMELKKRKRNKLQDDGFYLKRLRYD